ncbi:hypothetical protein JX265_008986 [Neoarthrinium moseri]|uniref:Methyltransferase domain-containing protein n=1 Tax=Neoarthrinium moseri TaxID=1658444 RepID=A0A9Q0AN35_9PEZI|nr:uncharacterized protein JN550_007856 [Neoarthrinium moseri]KAI1862940.1 hypothetical protein JX265_008986 [Neoarthrinium moseri]KAI1866167.1 hypothetical protein JN550_007856 [Neoarthrinium moseri]
MASEETTTENLAQPEYWDTRYASEKPGDPTHEWFRTYEDLSAFLERRLFAVWPPHTAPRILHLGAGKSTLPVRLVKDGYKNQLCVDFSSESVTQMSQEYAGTEGVEWKVHDVCQMDDIASKTIDVAFDKGTLDAMVDGLSSLLNPTDEVLELTSRYMREVFRVLKDNGSFLYVTYRTPTFMARFLQCEGTDWLIEKDILSEPGAIAYYGLILTKRPKEE